MPVVHLMKRVMVTNTLQRAYRRRYHYRGCMAIKITASLKRYLTLSRWKELVFMTIDLMHYATVTIQCSVRCFLARRRLLSLQYRAIDRYFRFEYCHDFRQDEAANWRAFGYDTSSTAIDDDAISTQESLYASHLYPVLELCDANSIPHSEKRLNPIPELLTIIDFPIPPLGCLFPSSSALLFMPCSRSSLRGDDVAHDRSDDKSSIQSSVVHSHLKRVIRSSTKPGSCSDISGDQCNSIGDIASTSITPVGLAAVDPTDIDRFYRECNTSFSVPFYTSLANKLQ